MSGSTAGSVTDWLRGLEAGDSEAARWLWTLFAAMMVALAATHLRRIRQPALEPEDIALDAFHNACVSIQQGAGNPPQDRGELWAFLTACTVTRARKARRDAARLKRGGQRPPDRSLQASRLCERLVNAAATAPDQVVAFSDWLEHLLSLLDQEDPTQRLRATALLKLEGCTDAEIAMRHTCSRKTVVLRLGLIRSLWAELSNQ